MTLAVAAASAVLHGGVLNELYIRLDARWGTPLDIASGVGRVLAMQAVFLFLWLPASALAFGAAAGFLYRTMSDETQRCTAAAFAGLPWHFAGSLELQGERWEHTVFTSSVFWLPSHAASYWFHQRWTPNFRTTWDGVVALLWNAYLLTEATGSPAVGPLLSGAAQSIAKWPMFADCGTWSVAAMTVSTRKRIALITDKVVAHSVAAWRRFYRWCFDMVHAISVAWRIWHTVVAWLWCNAGYYLRKLVFMLCLGFLWALIAARIAAYLVVMLVFKLLAALCGGFDQVKTFLMLWFVPSFFPYKSCPHCPLWPPNGTWPGDVLASPEYPAECTGAQLSR